jgi:hypothetical protein
LVEGRNSLLKFFNLIKSIFRERGIFSIRKVGVHAAAIFYQIFVGKNIFNYRWHITRHKSLPTHASVDFEVEGERNFF